MVNGILERFIQIAKNFKHDSAHADEEGNITYTDFVVIDRGSKHYQIFPRSQAMGSFDRWAYSTAEEDKEHATE